jgi:hypothetical protein
VECYNKRNIYSQFYSQVEYVKARRRIMAEINGVVIQPLSDGSQDREYLVEQLIFWGAGRAALAASSPKYSYVGLCANAAYMITAIGRLYDVDIKNGAVVGLVGGLGTAVATASLMLLSPFKICRVPIAVALTYALGKVANIWIQDGMPGDIGRYKPMIEEYFENGKKMASEIARDAGNSIPFTEGQRDLWAGIQNEVEWTGGQLKAKVEEKVTPLKEQWENETKYKVHDKAAEAVAKVTDKVSTAKDVATGASAMVTAAASTMAGNIKENSPVTLETVKEKAGAVLEKHL